MYDEATILAAYAVLVAAGDDAACARLRRMVAAGMVRPAPRPRPDPRAPTGPVRRAVPVARK